MSAKTLPQPTETLEQRFQRLLETWDRETRFHSSTTRIVEHPAYQEIISLGIPAIPFLLRAMEKTKNGHLAPALAAITGISPVLPEHRGKIRDIAADWVRWGRENRYQW
jgi:hypothetical protein